MKDKFLSKAYGGVTVARHRLYGLGLPRQWKVITSTLLLLFTFAIGNVWAAEVTAGKFYWANNTMYPVSTSTGYWVDEINLVPTTAWGTTNPTTSNRLKVYAGKGLTISTATGKKITKIEIAWYSSINASKITANEGSISNDATNKKSTWTGEETSVTINNTNSSDYNFSQIKVTYSEDDVPFASLSSVTMSGFYRTSYAVDNIYAMSCTKNQVAPGVAFKGNFNSTLKLANTTGTCTLYSPRPIASAVFTWKDGSTTKTPNLSASVGSYAAATSTWTAPNSSTNSFTLTNNETSGNNNIESIVVTFVSAATYNATFADGGHGTAPTAATGVSSVTLTEITGVDGWTNTGWTADKATKVGTADKAVGATLNIGDVVTLLENTTFTAQWAPAYDITYNKGAYGTGEIAGGTKAEDVAYTLSSSMFTRENYLQVGWATTDGASRSYMMGGSYTTNAAQEFFPAWAEKDTYVAAFSYDSENPAAPAGWTFSTGDHGATSTSVDYEGVFGGTCPASGSAANVNYIAFAKNAGAYATYDLGYVTTVSAVTGIFYVGSGNERTFKIEYIASDGTTVLHTISTTTNSNWGEKAVNETAIVPNVRYIKISSARKDSDFSWLVMSAFSVTYGSLVTKYDLTFAKNGGSGADMATLRYAEDAVVTLPGCTFTAPTNKTFDAWVVTKTASGNPITVTDGKFTMPAEAVTATATWKFLPKLTLTAGEGATGEDVVAYYAAGTQISVPEKPAGFSNGTKEFTGWVYSQAVTIEADKFAMPSNDLTLTAQWASATAVAQILGGDSYETFADAIAAVAAGQTIQLLADCSYDAAWNLTLAGTVTLDLNGHNLTYNGAGRGVQVHNGAKLVLEDGTATVAPTIDLTADPLSRSAITYTSGTFDSKDGMAAINGGEIEINSGRYLATEGVILVKGNGATATVNDGVLISRDNGVLMGNGTNSADFRNYVINVHGGILLGEIVSAGYASMVIYHPNVGELNIDGGTLVSTNGPAVVCRGGESNITGGTIVAQGSGSGKCGDASLVLPAVGVAYDFKSAYPGVSSFDAKISGDANVSGEAGAVKGIYAGTTPTTAEEDAVAISGGTFNSPVAQALCAENYAPNSWTDGTGTHYGVKPLAQSIDFEDFIDDQGTTGDWATYLSGHGYAISSTSDVSLDGGESGSKPADKGLKIKKTGRTITFEVAADKLVTLKVGSLKNAGASISVNGGAYTALESANPLSTGASVYTYYHSNAVANYSIKTNGDDYCIIQSIKIEDPYVVTYNANGGDEVAAATFYGTVLTLPSATKGTESFLGWFTAATGGEKIGEADENYTPSGDIELFAHWEAVSTDARLASITFSSDAGTLSPAFDPEVVNYTYTMPYGTAAIPQITGATAVNAGGSYSIVSQASAWDETAVIRGVAASSDTKAYNITMKLAPKDGICLIKGIVGNNTFVIDEDASLLSGTTEKRDVRSESSTYEALTGWKFQSKGAYLGITLDGDNTFQENDVVEVYVTTLAGDGTNKKVYVYTDKTTDNLSSVLLASSEADQKLGKNQVVLPATTTNKLYLCRGDDKKDYVNWNPYVAYFAVYRPLPPVLKKVTVNGVEGKPNALNEIVIEVAASTTQSELEAIAYEWVSNSDAWTANPANAPVAANAWEFGVANTVTLTDKDGDVSVYTVTVNKAIPSSNVELATLTVDGNAITLVPGQAVYSYEYPYGTAVTPAPVVAATAEDANAEVGTITPAATKNGTATFTVTAEDGITYRDYTVKISVSRIPSIAIYDGSTMDAIAENGSVNGLTWSITGANTLNATSAAGTFEGKNYAKEVNLFTSATKGEGEGDTRYVTITIPEDYVAKFRLVGASNSSGSDASANRSIFISKTKTGTLDKSIAYATSMNYNTLAGMTSDYQLPGVYYLCADKSIRLYELSVQLYPIDYSRATTEGRYGTICLPNGGIMVGATLYEVAYYGATSEKIFFDEILNGEMVAGVPYIYLPNEGADKLAVFYTDEANESAKSANGLVGYIGASENTSDALPVPHNDGNYILNNNQYREVVSANSAYILSHRAYIHLAGITPSEPALAPGRRRISMSVYSEQVATGIENTGFESEAPRKVLINGELFIIRGEKMYDAKGQLVK